MSQLLVIGNPAKRKRHRRHKAKHRARRSHRVHRAHRRHRRRSSFSVRARRNPISMGGIVPTLKDGALGAVGGIVNDMLYGFAASKITMLPQSGLTRNAAKIVTALAVGKIGGMVLRGKGGALARGAATVAIHSALKDQLSTMPFFASMNLGEYIEQPAALPMNGYDPGLPVDGYVDEEEGMGEYIEA